MNDQHTQSARVAHHQKAPRAAHSAHHHRHKYRACFSSCNMSASKHLVLFRSRTQTSEEGGPDAQDNYHSAFGPSTFAARSSPQDGVLTTTHTTTTTSDDTQTTVQSIPILSHALCNISKLAELIEEASWAGVIITSQRAVEAWAEAEKLMEQRHAATGTCPAMLVYGQRGRRITRQESFPSEERWNKVWPADIAVAGVLRACSHRAWQPSAPCSIPCSVQSRGRGGADRQLLFSRERQYLSLRTGP